MDFKVDDLNPGVWFDFAGEETGRVCLRCLNSDMLQDIRRRCEKPKKIFKHGNIYKDVIVDENLGNELTWDYCIVGWEDIYDGKGQEIECTKEMKILLMRKSVKFANFVAECLGKLTEGEEEHEKDLEKNSSASQGGS